MAILSATAILLLASSAVVVYTVNVLYQAIYNIWFHPLAGFPGPWTRKAWYFPAIWDLWSGKGVYKIHDFHLRYGTVVRLAPDQLSFIGSDAWKDIYAYQPNKRQLQKDYRRFPDISDALPILGSIDDSDHARKRRLVAPAFSAAGLVTQQPLLQTHLELFIEQLGKRADAGEVLDLNMWFNLLAFDIVSNISFGEHLHAVERGTKHQFVTDFLASCRMFPFIPMAWTYPAVKVALDTMMRVPVFMKSFEVGFRATRDRVKRRIAAGRLEERGDLMSFILQYEDKDRPMTENEIIGATSVLVNAGGESTAACLTASIYYLLTNPEAGARARAEIRTIFSSIDEMTLAATARLPYLQAVIQESLRLFPPNSPTNNRLTGPHGEIIDGHYIPANTSVGIHTWSANRSPTNFAHPDRFVPERWLADERDDAYLHDQREAVQPFSVGPRNCLGRNLAHWEIRSTLARMLWSFDMQLENPGYIWDQGTLQGVVWFRSPLRTKIDRRRH